MKKSQTASLSKNVITNTIGTVLLRSVSLITVPIISSLLAPNEYGKVSIFLTWVAILGVFVGLQASGSMQNALKKYGREEYGRYCSSTLFLSFISAIFIFLATVAFRQQISSLLKIDEILVYLIVPNCFGSFCVSYGSSYFLTLKNAKANFILTLGTTILVAACSLLCANYIHPNYLGYVFGFSLPYIIIGFGILITFIVKNKILVSKKYWKYCLMFSLPLIFHALSNTILGQSDKIMIQYLIENSDAQVGIYTMMHNIGLIVGSLWAALNSAFIPFYYDYLVKDDTDSLMKKCKNYAFLFTCLSMGFMLVGPELITLLIDAKYLSGLKIVPIVILSQYFVFLYSFSVNYEFYSEKTIWIAVGTMAAACLNIGLNFLFINHFGIMGVAIATTISYFLLFLFHEIIARKVIKKYPIPLRFFLINLLVVAVFGIITFVFFDIIWVRWAVFLVLSVVFVWKIIKQRCII